MPFAPGNKHGKGRPPVGLALATAVRQKWPPDRIVDLAEQLLLSEDSDSKVKLGVLTFLADRGYGKPVETVEVKTELTDDEYTAELAEIAREHVRSLPAEERVKLLTDPAPTDTIQ